MSEAEKKKLDAMEQAVKDRAAADLAKIKARRQAIHQRERAQARKDRTHRLIQMGALVEKYFGFCTPQEVEALCQLCCMEEDKKQRTIDAVKRKVVENMVSK